VDKEERAKIYVGGIDRMCFYIDAETLEPLGRSSYDPWVFSDPLPNIETITVNQWQVKQDEQRRRAK